MIRLTVNHARGIARGIARRTESRRRGSTLIYLTVVLPVLAGVCSLTVDYAHVQMVKTELRRTADATAHDYMVLYGMSGKQYANTNGPAAYSQNGANKVDSLSGVAPTVNVNWGSWNPATKAWSNGNNFPETAVKVTMSYTKANGNAVPLLFGKVLGAATCNVSVTSIASYTSQQSAAVTVNATSNPYFAGMPANTSSFNGDNATTNGATQVTALTVSPGDVITFSNFTGTSSVILPYMPSVGPAGVSGNPYGTATHHGVSWDGTGTPTDENGIADAIMPESSLMMVFLDDNAPDSTPAPNTVVDWTQPAMNNQSTYSNLQLKAPVYIGNGQTSGGATKQFIVPPGATRMYIGLWDGIQFNNNSGSVAGTITRKSSVQIVN